MKTDISAGYSQTPLAKKLGFKPGFRVRTINAPPNYLNLVVPVPEDMIISSKLRSNLDIDHVFVTSQDQLARRLPKSIKAIKQDGMIWVSWPKKSSGVKSNIREDQIREIALALGVVDIKVCSIDEIWSGLKLVIRRENRRLT